MAINSTNTNSPVQSVAKAAQILTCISHGIDRLTDIADELHLTYATTHRILKTLENNNLVFQNAQSHRYTPGLLFTTLAFNPDNLTRKLSKASMDKLDYLSEISGETIILDILVGVRKLIINKIQEDDSIKLRCDSPVYPRPDNTDIALLSLLPDDEIISIMEDSCPYSNPFEFEQETASMMWDVKRMRTLGVTACSKRRMPGLASIAAPVENYLYPVAITIIGPEYRIMAQSDLLSEKLGEISRIIALRLADEIEL